MHNRSGRQLKADGPQIFSPPVTHQSQISCLFMINSRCRIIDEGVQNYCDNLKGENFANIVKNLISRADTVQLAAVLNDSVSAYAYKQNSIKWALRLQNSNKPSGIVLFADALTHPKIQALLQKNLLTVQDLISWADTLQDKEFKIP